MENWRGGDWDETQNDAHVMRKKGCAMQNQGITLSQNVRTVECEKERHTLLCILKLFTDIIHELSLKNAWLPPIFLLDFNRTC